MSPMCQYSSREGHPTDWHFVHLGSRAVGGVGHILMEATAVSPEGRISPEDSGIWADEHIESFRRLTQFVKDQSAVIGIQLAHAGRKASTYASWRGKGVVPAADGGWQTIAPSAVPFSSSDPAPMAMTEEEIQKVTVNFSDAAKRSLKAGFQTVELHMAHGYLLHEFLSPISNLRTDRYGGSLENRMRFPLEVAAAVRKVWPEDLPLLVRISATDWADDGGWTLEDSVVFSQRLKDLGVDMIDCSTGGTLAEAKIPVGPGYQVPFASAVKSRANILTAAVGLITSGQQAETILATDQADAVFIGRELLRDPYFVHRIAREMRQSVEKPPQYLRG